MHQDWRDIDFALAQNVDFIAISFVKSADVINNLKSYVSSRAEKTIEIISKVESFDSVPNLQEIVEASDGVMVARGDLGKQIKLKRSTLSYRYLELEGKIASLAAMMQLSHVHLPQNPACFCSLLELAFQMLPSAVFPLLH